MAPSGVDGHQSGSRPIPPSVQGSKAQRQCHAPTLVYAVNVLLCVETLSSNRLEDPSPCRTTRHSVDWCMCCVWCREGFEYTAIAHGSCDTKTEGVSDFYSEKSMAYVCSDLDSPTILTKGSATWVCHSWGLFKIKLLSVSRILLRTQK